MLQVTNVGLRFGDKELFKDVNLKFTKGNCYGIIGANGAGKSTFLKILAGDIEPNTGSVSITEKERMSVLRQDHFKYEEDTVLNVVIMGHERLYQIMQEKDALYMKEDFSEEDGIKAAELEGEFAELDGWDAENNAERLFIVIVIDKDMHYKQMKELTGGEKVKVLLAQALFGKPEILVMDEPTNHLDFQSINWLNNFIMDLEDSIVIVVSHDRHFLNQICTNIVDVDFGKIQMYVGNYDFWYESSQLALQLAKDQNKKAEEKIAQLKEFIARFSSNAETNAERLLMGLGITKDLHYKQMKELTGGEKVKELLDQALFGKPEILIMDEPTNHLDFQSINLLINFIMVLEDSIVIVVSHDRHFLNQICTNIVDVDFVKIQMYVGNYDFWYESSQLALQLAKDQNKKAEEKIAQLKEFIARFSSNASKAKQATSRKKQLDKIQVEEIQPSRRRYPYVGFTPEREIGNEVLEVEGLTKTVDGVKVLDNISFRLDRDDKAAFMGDEIAITTLFNILMGEDTADSGTFKWGVTTSQSYLPKNHNQYFDGVEYSLVDWLRQYSEEKSESFIRGFLGRMLFSGEEALKQAQVLSGGEKVRCMLSKLMLSNANVLVLDDPTNHLDLESITSVNKGLEKFQGVLLFNSHDQEMIQTLANRIIEITPGGIMDRKTTLDEYLENKDIQKQLKEMYGDTKK